MPDRLRAVLTVLIALGCCVLGATAQTAEERADAVAEFKRFFRRFKEPGQQVEAIRTLEGMESAAACDELLKLLDHRSPEVVRAAMDVLGTYREAETFAGPLAELVDMGDSAVQARLIAVLGEAGIDAALPEFTEIAAAGRVDTEVASAICAALAKLGKPERSTAILRGFLDSDDGLVELAAARAIGALRIKELGDRLLPLLESDAWQVQSAAVSALAAVREPRAVQPLIDLMQQGGRLEEECAEALFRITGYDFGTDADTWQSTWDRLQSIEGWRVPTDAELAKRAASRKKYDAIYGVRDDPAPTFGGIPTTSRRILFIIDVSGSMADLVVERERFDADYEDFRKLTIVKTELVRTIESLPDGTLFNVVAFASDLDTWKRRPTRANIVNRASAVRWVEKLKPIGGPEMRNSSAAALAQGKTNTFKALMHPFGFDPDARRPAPHDPLDNPIDTVYFLSDGRPSTGAHTDAQTIIEEVRRLNGEFGIVFHAIAIGQFQKDFLRSLAELNGGVFVDLGS